MNLSLVRYKVVDQYIYLPQVWTFLCAGQALNTCLHHKIYLTFNTEVSFILFHEDLYLQCSITHLLLQYLGPLSSAKTAALEHPTLAHRLGSLGWRENSLSSHSPTSRELRGLTNVSVHEFYSLQKPGYHDNAQLASIPQLSLQSPCLAVRLLFPPLLCWAQV